MSLGFVSASCKAVRSVSSSSEYHSIHLHSAIIEGNEQLIKTYLDNKTDPNCKDQNGRTPLSFIVHLLCTTSQNINKVSESKLHDMAIHLLNNEKTDPNIKDNEGNTPLSILLRHKHFNLARIFLSYPKTNPNEFLKCGHTELTKAIQFDDLDILECLLAFPQTDPNLVNEYGDLPLDLAIRCGDKNEKLAKVKLLLAHPYIVVTTKFQNGESPLSTAIKLRHAEIVNLLLPLDHVNGQIALENYCQLGDFQKGSLFIFSKEEINKIRHSYKKELDELYHNHPGNNVDDFVSYHAVEGMSEVASILSQVPQDPRIHRIGFIDMDDTLVFTGLLGWVNESFNKLNMGEGEYHKAIQLLKKYGFNSVQEFADWGNDMFGVYAGNWDDKSNMVRNYFFNCKDNFCAQSRVIDSQVSSIFKKWNEEGMNLFGLTARCFGEKMHRLTKSELHEENIDLTQLSRIAIEKPEKDISEGIIYCEPKFGKKGGGIQFMEMYLEKLSIEQQTFPNVEIIVVDNYRGIFTEIISLSNRNEIQRLEQKFNTKITFRYFQPFEELWQTPDKNWGKLQNFVDDHQPSRIALQALEKFLREFC